MNASDRPRLGRGVRLRREGDGSAMLLVPEGALMLNGTAAATLELLDGHRTVGDIAGALAERFDVDVERAQRETGELLQRLAERRFVELP
ncbi:MAG: pyrroloquinoline quinone biosynthesis peptide chaperone PqqD [Candidatus Eremiobacteraeota bacterium]|nr:pyrroloquinoline quinone biosynthesis peptide chaperone PqqD [Candidatus Eremiobacteraeota bacterium]MBV8721218.1 pyrroloquinoline quinone biosynthesis peptide chaperone PqqD [Candidatus Eremiobacteraeota bacterium]